MKELSIEEKAKRYDEALKWMENVYPTLSHEQQMEAEVFFPIFKESEDERIRKDLIIYLRSILSNKKYGDKFIEGWIAWLEKQGNTNETIKRNEFAQGVLKGAAINLITWIDYNAAEGNMCLSNMECEDIEDALVSGDWDKIYAYIKKKLEKQGDDNKEYWRGYREGKQEILDKYAELERNGEQNPNPCDGCINRNGYINCENGELREVEQKSADKVEPKFKVKYAGCEYNVLEVKDIAGVTYYGIEDEPNHIDYVKADNCKIISSGYGIKENGSPYPTKTAVFSEQKPAWSEEDEEKFRDG